MLTAQNGMTLYVFDKDKGDQSVCYDDCAVNWPPYVGTADEKMPDDWKLVQRTDGTMQWTYDVSLSISTRMTRPRVMSLVTAKAASGTSSTNIKRRPVPKISYDRCWPRRSREKWEVGMLEFKLNGKDVSVDAPGGSSTPLRPQQ